MANDRLGIHFLSYMRLWASFGLVYLILQTSAFADYRLAAGDVVELSVAGFPDLRQKAVIGVDGEIVLPLVGSIKATNLTLSELSLAVRQAYSSAVLQQRTPGGQSEPIVITSNEITLQVAEYRPVYLGGDVANPGQQAYRPGMTLRQAVMVAGGYGAGRAGISNPRLEAIQIRGEIEALWVQQVKDQASAWRLNNELTERDAPFPDFSKAPLDRRIVDQIKATEENQLRVRREDLTKRKASIEKTIEQADRRLDLLANQMKNEEAGSQADADDFARVSALFERGNVAVSRLSDARRTMLFSGTRVLQTTSAMTQLERERETLRRSLEELAAKTQIELNDNLQQVNARIAQSDVKLAALEERYRYMGGSRLQMQERISLSIIRKSAAGVERITAQEDDELRPGDVIEVTVMDEP
jgi:polysaccharide export outer membrane protein